MGLPDEYHAGDPFGVRARDGRLILDTDAAVALNRIRAELARLDRWAVSPPLEYSSDAAGRRWRIARPAQVYAKLSGTGSPYTWAEATRAADGTSSLVTGGRSGTAYEVNAATGLNGKYATLDWTTAGDWRFQAIRDGSTGSTTNQYAPIPDCFCTQSPLTITMTSADSTCNYQMFQSCTIQWGPIPPEYADLSLGDNGYLSNESFTDPIAADSSFRYFLICYHNEYTLTRVYATSPYGSPYRDGILYTWLLGATSNTCSPFNLNDGTAAAGSNCTPLNPVTLTG